MNMLHAIGNPVTFFGLLENQNKPFLCCAVSDPSSVSHLKWFWLTLWVRLLAQRLVTSFEQQYFPCD